MFIVEIINGRKYSNISKIKEFNEYFENQEIYLFEDSFYLESKRKGISLTFDLNLYLSAIHLYSQGYDAYSQYQGELPKKINFDMNKSEVENILGGYDNSSGGNGKEIANWIKFKLNSFDMHFQFTNTDKISLITLFNFGNSQN